MRILHLDSGRELRGGQWQVLRLLEGLTAQAIDSTLLARKNSPLYAEARRRGLHVEPLSLLRTAAQARRHDLVHAHDARGHTLAALAGGAPLIVSRRVAFPIVSRWKYRRARRYLAVSKFVKSVLISGGVPADRIAVVYDGVPLLEPARPEIVIAPANAADPRKGASLAAEAARLANVPLHFSSHLERDLPRAAALLYITHSEGLGSGALLAMSAGVPVIASDTGGLPEIVRHEETGLIVRNDPEVIAAALRRLIENPSEALRLGAAARQSVIDNFTVQRMLQRTIEVYRQVLS